MLEAARALELAIKYQADQKDKAGKPYLGHLLRVAARVADNEMAVSVALLHDIVEDTAMSLHELLELAFDPAIVRAVGLLTKDRTLTYFQNLARIIEAEPDLAGRLALRVKIADIQDNLDPLRDYPDKSAFETGRYEKALRLLQAKYNDLKKKGVK